MSIANKWMSKNVKKLCSGKKRFIMILADVRNCWQGKYKKLTTLNHCINLGKKQKLLHSKTSSCLFNIFNIYRLKWSRTYWHNFLEPTWDIKCPSPTLWCMLFFFFFFFAGLFWVKPCPAGTGSNYPLPSVQSHDIIIVLQP